MRTFLRHWRAYSNKEWNRRCLEVWNTPYAVLSPVPFKRRLRLSLKFTILDLREALALRIAPWLEPDK